ncbi:hypothetical protein DXG01_016755, partial [Tephrocybe rancida]
ARDRMTAEQRRYVDNRNENVRVTAHAPRIKPNTGELSKGKGVDPHNWGNANISGDEIDPDVQRQILQACNDNMNRARVVEPEPSENSDSERDDTDGEEACPTRQELKDHIKERKKLKEDIRKLKKELKRSSKSSKKAARCSASVHTVASGIQDILDQPKANKKA